MAAIPESTKTSLQQRLSAHAREHWPGITRITVRFHGRHAYIGAIIDHSEGPDTEIKLLRLRYGGYAGIWGVALRRASHDDYQPTRMPDGTTAATPQDALDLAAGLYLPEAAA
jgi:hypothetical protein